MGSIVLTKNVTLSETSCTNIRFSPQDVLCLERTSVLLHRRIVIAYPILVYVSFFKVLVRLFVHHMSTVGNRIHRIFSISIETFCLVRPE